MSWRTKRKLIYTLIVVLPLVAIAAAVYSATFFPDPTCFDGEQNGTELGVDCGGACELVCQAQVPDVDVVWARSFQVSGDNYNLTSYIENPNTELVAKSVPYVFRIYDKDNILITERRGEITLLPQPANVVFEDGVDTNGRVPARTTFEFLGPPFWESASRADTRFQISNQNLELGSRPRLTLTASNRNTRPFSGIGIAALIFNRTGEVVQVSRTVIDELSVDGSEGAIFTWREPFSSDDADSYRVEIVPTTYDPLP